MAPIMCLDRPPGVAIGDVDEAQRAVAEGEGKRGAGAVEAGGNNEGVEFTLGAAGLEQEPGGGFAIVSAPPPPTLSPARGGEHWLVGGRGPRSSPHQSTAQPSNPRRSRGLSRSRPMNTIRLTRGSPSFHGPMKSPSAIIPPPGRRTAGRRCVLQHPLGDEADQGPACRSAPIHALNFSVIDRASPPRS